MPRIPQHGGPQLPKALVDQVSTGRISKRNQRVNRKDTRKAERIQKKAARTQQTRKEWPVIPLQRPIDRAAEKHQEGQTVVEVTPKLFRAQSKPAALPSPPEESDLEVDENNIVVDSSNEEDDASEEEDTATKPVVSKAIRAKLEEDDDEIARLERKLGIRSKNKNKVGDDELDRLISGDFSDKGEEEEEQGVSKKRVAPEDDEWLQKKRLKASKKEPKVQGVVNHVDNPFSEDEISEGDFEEFDESEEEAPTRERENPYIAPVAKNAAPTAKYIPPSKRATASSSDEELLKQLKRQLQGQLNRLSEANLLSILAAIQDIYNKNARQHCTSVLLELFRDLICDPSILDDNFLILHSGFATALYRTIGTDFGAQLLEVLVKSFDQHHTADSEGKQTLNLLAFLCDLYTLQATGSDIVFDYIRMLLENFSEANTALLLRVIRISGHQLRQDDPSSLKDIVLLLQRSVTAAGGEEKVSVRTKFMMESIHNLKNNRVRANAGLSQISAEHMQRMKKILGTIKNPKTIEPLRITLTDIRDSEKKGKWWLVGASWRDPAKVVNGSKTSQSAIQPTKSTDENDVSSNEEKDGDDVDLDALARSQGMNTDVRRAIFVSIAGALDPQHAFLRVQKLSLKNKQQVEITRVLLHCVGAEPVYNHYYTLVAVKFCNSPRLWKAWQSALADVFRKLGDGSDGQDDDDAAEDDGQDMSVRQVYNVAKMYATLISEGLLRLSVLKNLTFTTLQPKTKLFAEVLLANLFLSVRKKCGREGYEKAVKTAFEQVHAVQDMVRSLTWFVENVVAQSTVPGNKKETRIVVRGCEYAAEALREDKNKRADGGLDEDEDEREGSLEVEWD